MGLVAKIKKIVLKVTGTEETGRNFYLDTCILECIGMVPAELHGKILSITLSNEVRTPVVTQGKPKLLLCANCKKNMKTELDELNKEINKQGVNI